VATLMIIVSLTTQEKGKCKCRLTSCTVDERGKVQVPHDTLLAHLLGLNPPFAGDERFSPWPSITSSSGNFQIPRRGAAAAHVLCHDHGNVNVHAMPLSCTFSMPGDCTVRTCKHHRCDRWINLLNEEAKSIRYMLAQSKCSFVKREKKSSRRAQQNPRVVTPSNALVCRRLPPETPNPASTLILQYRGCRLTFSSICSCPYLSLLSHDTPLDCKATMRAPVVLRGNIIGKSCSCSSASTGVP
jgi:hypothetical protein